MNARNKVQKSLTPEEKSIIANVKSLLEQLEQAEGDGGLGNEDTEGTSVEMAAMTDGLPAGDEEQEELEEKKVEKSETASDDADERLDELPVDDEEALKVLKALLNIGNRSSVRKSAISGDEIQIRTLKVLKSIQKRLDEQEEAISGILEGIGVADQIVAVRKSARPVNPKQSSAEDVLRLIANAAGVGARVEKSADAEPVGTIKDVLTELYR